MKSFMQHLRNRLGAWDRLVKGTEVQTSKVCINTGKGQTAEWRNMLLRGTKCNASQSRPSHFRPRASVAVTIKNISHVHYMRGATRFRATGAFHVVRWATMQPCARGFHSSPAVPFPVLALAEIAAERTACTTAVTTSPRHQSSLRCSRGEATNSLRCSRARYGAGKWTDAGYHARVQDRMYATIVEDLQYDLVEDLHYDLVA